MTTRTYTMLLFALLIGPAGASVREPIPIEALSRVPEIQSVSLSLDGRNVVALVPAPGSNGERTALATWDVQNLGAGPVLTPSEVRAEFVSAWALKNGHVMVRARQEYTGRVGRICSEGRSLGTTRTMVTKSFLTDVSHSRFREAFAEKLKRSTVCSKFWDSAELVQFLPLSPDDVIVMHRNFSESRDDYYRYDLRTGDSTLFFHGAQDAAVGFLHPRTGEPLTQIALISLGRDDFEEQIFLRNSETGVFEPHAPLASRLNDRNTVEIVGLDEATGQFHVLTDKFSDQVQAWTYDPSTRAFGPEPLVAHPEYSVGALIYGRHQTDFGQILGFELEGVIRQAVYVDPILRAIQAGLVKAFPDRDVHIRGFDEDRSTVLFSTDSPRHSIAYHLLLDRQRVVTLGVSRPSIAPESIGEQRWVSYTASDGRQIPALLDLPPGWSKDQGPLPTVVQPHGGPWDRDYGGWDASGWTPFLTSRGVAVLRPQFRGSTGFGREHWIAGDAEWGQAMQDDKDDGARWLVSEGIADPGRIAILGYSYGGYAATAATVRPNSPYRCAIAGAPITHLDLRGNRWTEGRVQRALQGRTIEGLDPIKHADKASIPVLLFVGDRDTRTPAFHARDFHNAVRGKVRSRFELIEDMPHSAPWYYRHNVTIFELIEAFLNDECFSDESS